MNMLNEPCSFPNKSSNHSLEKREQIFRLKSISKISREEKLIVQRTETKFLKADNLTQ